MDIDLPCNGCVGNLFRAIGRVMDECPGASNIRSVHVFQVEEVAGGAGAAISWEFGPDDRMIEIFRDIWDAETEMVQCVINHESPGITPDVPVCLRNFYKLN